MTKENRTGTITRDGDIATIRFQRRLPHRVTAVWTALTDSASRRAWFGETRFAGGRVEFLPDVPDAEWISGRVLAWDPPHLLAHEWNGVARYELIPCGKSDTETDLIFTHRGAADLPAAHAFLDRLEFHLAGAPIPSWPTRYLAVQPLYPQTQ
ncbi:SRPBCC domain-containing protein [Amycolatopsis nigrescens]|uniref:SRPBCC domain-containing protein n=1 Tax=Amycolatopsis nigrescens TaxID=381445 RepID=UPI00037967EA|nr:SRPBCC domain-containing protein [Amycolatopsis nigrescens]